MTNLEYLVAALTDEIDDGGASYEAALFYNIACPYHQGDMRCHCGITGYSTSRELCFGCKDEWLNSEYQ